MWAIFGSESDLFGRTDQQWMINFRVRDLDAIVRQLRDADLAVESTRRNTRTAGSLGSQIPMAIPFSSGSQAEAQDGGALGAFVSLASPG